MYAVEISKFIQPSEVGNNKETRSVDFYNYNLAVRYHHMFLVMPGGLEDEIGGVLDYDKIKVAIFDVRTKDEVMRWPMEDCGNGNYNATAFEECDYARKPPAYDHSYRTAGDVFYWGESDGGDGNYYTCNDICLRQPIGLCGDGIKSNGPKNTDMREACDDGNTISGDGCSSDCKTVEVGYECPVWG